MISDRIVLVNPPNPQLHSRFDANIVNLYFRIDVYANL